jgi:hypothetical protein
VNDRLYSSRDIYDGSVLGTVCHYKTLEALAQMGGWAFAV